MLRESIARFADPRLRRPVAGVLVSYLAWAGVLMLVSALGWNAGTVGQRWLAATLPMLPILALAGFLLRLYRHGDEVERAMYSMAASAGFVAMLVAALLAMHLQRSAAPVELTATHIWAAGMVAWLIGLAKAWRDYR